MPPQHPSSYPGYVHTDESDADTLSPYYYDFPQQGGANLDADTYANVRRSFFPGQELNHSYNGMNGASFAPPIASGPYNSCPSSTTGTASPEMNHLISFSDSQSIPSPSPSGVTEQSSGVEYEGMTTAIPPETQYRERIATPKVVEISQSRRKKGGNSFKCEKCGATLTSRQNLKYHTNAHFNIKPFLCVCH
ncbi:hypothetical protein L218DRAFT_623027 [Marasmius fiardii PR-910]|nr:hypothetical protein L218DRAFT_623027 [Marasmius fiardii PR-910]